MDATEILKLTDTRYYLQLRGPEPRHVRERAIMLGLEYIRRAVISLPMSVVHTEYYVRKNHKSKAYRYVVVGTTSSGERWSVTIVRSKDPWEHTPVVEARAFGKLDRLCKAKPTHGDKIPSEIVQKATAFFHMDDQGDRRLALVISAGDE